MAEQKVQIRKLRDFGENLSDTFQFIRQEFKPLMLSFILIAGIFILMQSVLGIFYQTKVFAFLDDLKGGTLGTEPVTFEEMFTPAYFLMIFVSLITVIIMPLIIACYIKLYDATGTSPTINEVWAECRKYFFRVLIFSIPEYLIIIVGYMFCIVPGIYFSVVFAPFKFIIVQEDASFSEAFNRCFAIVKNNFWSSLGIYLVALLIYYFASMSIGSVFGIIVGSGSYFSTKEISSSIGIASSVINMIGKFFYIILCVSVALNYYNLIERTEGTGISRRLEQLGSNINPNTNIEEQY